MSANDGVVIALTKALESSPDDMDVRLHLATILLDKDDFSAALEHFSVILAADPVNIAALEGAQKASSATGDTRRAAAYAKLLAGLGHATTPGVPSNAEAEPDTEPKKIRVGGPPELRVVGGAAASDATDVDYDSDDDRITLADVAGLEAVKQRIELAFLGPLRNPAMAKAYGKKMRGGLLLYGPPGCGKTYIARALAGELNAGFMSVGLSDVLNMYIGESEQRLHALFEMARTNAPTVIFMDELDALGRKRSDLHGSGIREVVNQLLQELDGMHTGNEAVFVLGATNLPWDIDVALKRPGRFDRAIFVEPPDIVAREHILSMNLAERPAGKINLPALAKKTRGYSGADLAFVCELATERTLERAMQSGVVELITDSELKAAQKEVRPSIASWFETARNYAMYANASGEFNDLAEYIQQNKI
ncbi:MAG: AAA family ATPase [Gammaproteobacteria bacterium]|nr:AAA family ATPase [Gammaproteobacteria bacterium]